MALTPRPASPPPRLPHAGVLARHQTAGLRTVAAFEAAKGLVVMLVGFGLLSLVHHDVQHAAESIVRHLHMNPARHVPRVFLEAAGRMTDKRLWLLAAGAFAYSTVRLAEAYGLWRARPWAEWLAILSGGLYVPVEVYELGRDPTTVKAAILAVNVGIVLYVAWVRRYNAALARAAAAQA